MKKKSKKNEEVFEQSVLEQDIQSEDSPELKKAKMIYAVDMLGCIAFIDWDTGDKDWISYDYDKKEFTYESGGTRWTLDFEKPFENGGVSIVRNVNNFNMLHEKLQEG